MGLLGLWDSKKRLGSPPAANTGSWLDVGEDHVVAELMEHLRYTSPDSGDFEKAPSQMTVIWGWAEEGREGGSLLQAVVRIPVVLPGSQLDSVLL